MWGEIILKMLISSNVVEVEYNGDLKIRYKGVFNEK